MLLRLPLAAIVTASFDPPFIKFRSLAPVPFQLTSDLRHPTTGARPRQQFLGSRFLGSSFIINCAMEKGCQYSYLWALARCSERLFWAIARTIITIGRRLGIANASIGCCFVDWWGWYCDCIDSWYVCMLLLQASFLPSQVASNERLQEAFTTNYKPSNPAFYRTSLKWGITWFFTALFLSTLYIRNS
jgi:hypothetical protein